MTKPTRDIPPEPKNLFAKTPPQPAQPELAPIYYMRDNHTFKKLSADVRTALVEIEHEFNEGYTYGALCSKREGFQDVHASGSKKRLEFFAECKTTLEKWLPTSPPASNQCKFPLCQNEDYQQALAEQIKQELYTGEPAQHKPLEIGDESAAFKEWFDAWWVGDGDICKAVTNEVEQTRGYKSQYTLAFGAWMAAKHAANGTKENV